MNQILISALFASGAFAGALNIVQLGPPDVIRLEITCAEKKQEVDLPHGGTTGQFSLPEIEATIRLPGTKIPELTIPATASPNIAVLSAEADKYRWSIIPGKPSENKWAMRAVNLTGEPTTVALEERAIELKTDSPTELPVAGKSGMSVKIKDGETFTYEGSEPCAVVALIHRKDGEIHVLFVPDR